MRTKTMMVAGIVALCVTALVSAQTEKPAAVDVPLKNWAINFEKYITPAVAAATQTSTGKVPLQARTDVVLPSKNTTFIAIAPCRQYDSRSQSQLAGNTSRTINMDGAPCGLPATAIAYSVGITAFGSVPNSTYGFITAYPTGTTKPVASTFNYLTGSQTSSAAIVPDGAGGDIDIYTTTTTDFVIDVNGYLIDSAGGLAATAATPNTLVLRDGNGDFQAHDITATGKVVGAVYQDFAEWVPSVSNPEAGTVVVLDPKDGRRVMASTRAYDTTVAGVVSANPGIVLGPEGPDRSQIATTGRVDVFVDATKAPIAIGDLLVTSDTPGMAMKSVPLAAKGGSLHRPGTIIGKALEPLASGQGKIKILLSLQ